MDNVVAPQYLEVKIKASKTGPFCQGVSVYIGVTAGDLCPVVAILDYMACRTRLGVLSFSLRTGNSSPGTGL